MSIELSRRVKKLEKLSIAQAEALARLEVRIARLETKRGRPRKDNGIREVSESA